MLHTKQFYIDNKTMSMTADMSDLGRDPFVRIYPDACDIGFPVISHKTGKVTMWVQVDEARNSEGELLTMTLRPTSESIRTNPGVDNWKIILFND